MWNQRVKPAAQRGSDISENQGQEFAFGNMDGPRNYTKWNKSDRERQISYITHVKSKKMTQMNLFTKQK